MLKKTFWIFLLSLIPLVSVGFTQENDLYKSILQKDKLTVGISFDSKPFGFKDTDGKVKGMEADLAREIANRILTGKNSVVFKKVSSQERIKAVSSGDVDMVISTLTITPQRKKLVDFSDPYFVAGQAICVRRDGKINSVDDLINKKVIVVLGTTGEKNIKQLAPNALIQGYVDNAEAIAAFKQGYADAITTDDSLLQGLTSENGNYMLLPKRLTKEPYGIAFKKSKRANSLKNNVNKVIKEIKLDGTLLTIKSKWEVN